MANIKRIVNARDEVAFGSYSTKYIVFERVICTSYAHEASNLLQVFCG